MVGIRDFFDAFKPAFKSGRTDPETWRNLEEFGRFDGVGEVRAEFDLPKGGVVISAEELRDVHNLYRIASAELSDPGLHQLRVSAQDPKQTLWILVGREMGATDFLRG
jgi:hypothetical protein